MNAEPCPQPYNCIFIFESVPPLLPSSSNVKWLIQVLLHPHSLRSFSTFSRAHLISFVESWNLPEAFVQASVSWIPTCTAATHAHLPPQPGCSSSTVPVLLHYIPKIKCHTENHSVGGKAELLLFCIFLLSSISLLFFPLSFDASCFIHWFRV